MTEHEYIKNLEATNKAASDALVDIAIGLPFDEVVKILKRYNLRLVVVAKDD